MYKRQGLSIATLLAQHHEVMAIDIIEEKVNMINNRKSPIQDNEIEAFLSTKNLNLVATLNAKEAYSDACLLYTSIWIFIIEIQWTY